MFQIHKYHLLYPDLHYISAIAFKNNGNSHVELYGLYEAEI